MAKRKKKRRNRSDAAGKTPLAKPASVETPPREKRTAARSVRPWLLGATTALLVAGPLVPGEASAAQGHGLLLVMLWIALAVVWLLAWLGRDRWEVRFGRLDVTVLALIGLHTLAALWATTHAAPRPAVNMLWHWVGFGLCFFMARQLVAGAREARALATVMIALAVTLAAYGIYQAAHELPQTRARFAADPDGMLRDKGMLHRYPPGSPERLLFDKRLQSREPLASFALTNSLAGFLTPWLIVLAGAVVATASRAMRGRACAIVAGCGLPVIVCLLLTKSRAAYAAVAVGAFLLWWMSHKREHRIGWRIPTAVGVGAAVLVTLVAWTGALDRQVFSEASKSLGVRGQYWRASLDLIGDHPWLGCGPGNFQDTYTAYKLPNASEEIADPHNFLLEAWATAGTPAALALLAVMACFASVVIRGTRAAPPRQETKPQPTSVPHVLGGAVSGLLLAFAVGVLAEMPPSPVVLLAGISVGTGCVWLLWPWLRRGSFPAFVPAVAVMALLVNLTAAGGIGFPSIAGTFWLLLALGANLAQGKTDRRRLPGWTTYLALAVAMALVLACYASAYRPVLESQAALQSASENPIRAEALLQKATDADPLTAEPWRRLADREFNLWRVTGSEEALDWVNLYTKELLKRAPRSSADRIAAGDRHIEASQYLQRPEDRRKASLDRAIDYYRQAVARYPTHAAGLARLALALDTSGDRAAAGREAEKALQLHENTPHEDQKLPQELRDPLLPLRPPVN